MSPDRTNYEIWFIDWLDGNLSQSEADQLFGFLDQNPDLKEELNDLKNLKLEPGDMNFRNKGRLFKSPEDLTDSQFDYLCVAYLENDISDNQKAELKEIISRDQLKRNRFEIYQKLKLSPGTFKFKNKSSVKKLTITRKIISFTAFGLSAAAAVAFFIMLSFPASTKSNINEDLISGIVTSDTFLLNDHPPLTNKTAGIRVSVFKEHDEAVNVGQSDYLASIPVSDDPSTDIISSETRIEAAEIIPLAIVNISGYNRSVFPNDPAKFILRPFNPVYLPDPDEDYRSNVDRFVARIFHEKIMRDTIIPERPIKRFELATAGITGINKLFGWEMALHKNINESGDIKSYAFSSGFLKFNAPVKKAAKTL